MGLLFFPVSLSPLQYLRICSRVSVSPQMQNLKTFLKEDLGRRGYCPPFQFHLASSVDDTLVIQPQISMADTPL